MVQTCQRNVRNTIRIIVFFTAISICAYQVYLVSVLYFAYPTTVDTRLDPSPNVHLPGITVCSELSSTILVEELVKIRPELYKTFAGKTRTEIAVLLKKHTMRDSLLRGLHSLPIDQQHQLTVKSDMFIKQCQVPTPLGRLASNHQEQNSNVQSPFSVWQTYASYKSINCSHFTPIIETISWDFKCFTLFHNHTFTGGDHNYEIPKDVAANFKYLIWLQLNRDFMFNGLVYVHSPAMTHQYGGSSSIQQLDPDKHQFVSVAFDRNMIQLLPPPYTTNCFDYREAGFLCREDCLTQCKTARYLRIDGWPGDVFANKSIAQRFSQVWANQWSSIGHIEEGINAESLASCSKECGEWDDCESTLYDVRTVRVETRDEEDLVNSHLLTVGILPPKSVRLRSKHVPKFEPIEFLIYIGSLIGLYLGVSFMSMGVGVLTCMTFSAKFQTDCLLWRCCCGEASDSDFDDPVPSTTIGATIIDSASSPDTGVAVKLRKHEPKSKSSNSPAVVASTKTLLKSNL